MKAVAPLARPVFSWNHRSLMAEDAHGLASRLGASLLAPPVGVLLPPARVVSPRGRPGDQEG